MIISILDRDASPQPIDTESATVMYRSGKGIGMLIKCNFDDLVIFSTFLQAEIVQRINSQWEPKREE